MAEQASSGIKPIDIKALFIEKNPRLARLIPGFVYGYITKKMHIPEVNEILSKYGDQKGIEFANSIIKHFNVSQEVENLDKIQAGKRYIFASNHPLGGFDGLLLMSNVSKSVGEVRFLVNDVLMKIPQLGNVFVPLNKHGGNSREVALKIHEYYESDIQILIFPSGLASRKIKGKIVDLEWHKHFIQKAIEYKRDVVPVHVSGGNSKSFYSLANIRKRLRIKWNLEMFFLPDETFRHRGQKFKLTFGEPIPYQSFDKSKTQKDWAEYVRRKVYQLPGKTS